MGAFDAYKEATQILIEEQKRLCFKFEAQLNCFDRNKIGYKFAFIFSSPAYLELKGEYSSMKKMFAPLSYTEEYDLIKETLVSSKKEINVIKMHGTTFNFDKLLAQDLPGAIHFSGHGLTADEIKKDNVNNQGFTMMTDEDIEEIY